MFLINLKSYLSKAYYQFPLPIDRDEWGACHHGPKVLANSFPKGGTHLLTRVLSLTPSLVPRWKAHIPSFEFSPHQLSSRITNIRQGQYLTAHFYHNQELLKTLNDHNVKTLFIVRDLRDVAVSRAYYLTYSLRTRRMKAISDHLNSLENDSERVMAGILGIDENNKYWPSIGELAANYYPWLNTPNCLTIRFEDLVGSNGGGNSSQQIKVVDSILNHLEIEASETQVSNIASQAFYRKSATFRKGKINDWKNQFTESHKQAFKDIAGDLIIKFGYESGFDW